MNFWLILPILIPMFAGGILAMSPTRWLRRQRALSVIAAMALLPLAAWFVYATAGGTIHVSEMGNWPAPFGIVLQADRLSAMMLGVTAMLGSATAVFAGRGDARLGRHFDALLQFQLMGLNGAFLAGDLFNLFVFFEILLIASYALLVHGGGAARIGAGLHYVLINLAGSAFFLVALGILYGVTGTLNMADMGRRLALLPPDSWPLATAGGVMLLLVFSLKAAIFPLYFWLPRAYGAATGSVAALFAIMTKVGIYAILRSQALVFGAGQGLLAGFLYDLVWWLGLGTMLLGAIGALSATRLKSLTAYLVLTSVGLLSAGVAMQSAAAWAGTLYYLVSTTLCTAAMFLLADALDVASRQADKRANRKAAKAANGTGSFGFAAAADAAAAAAAAGGVAGRQAASAAVPETGTETGAAARASRRRGGTRLAGGLFLLAAIAAIGLPPMSGFVGKVMLMRAASDAASLFMWPVVLLSSLLLIIAVSRAGTRQLWSAPHFNPEARRGGASARVVHVSVDRWKLACCAFLLAGNIALVLFAQPVTAYLEAAAVQLLDPAAYRQAVLKGGN